MKNEPHIPTLIGLVLLILGLGSTFFLVEKGSSLWSQAQTLKAPTEITLANVSDTSFSLSWLTEEPTLGFIEYKEQTLFSKKQVALDIRDNQKATPRYTHFVTVNKLKENTAYNVKIVGNQTPNSNLSFKTGPTLGSPTETVNPAFGVVVDASDIPVDDTLVHASFEGSQTISSLISENGQWVIPLGTLRSSDLSRYFVPSKLAQERLFFVGKKGKSIVTTTIENDSPLPLVRLGSSYDFTKISGRFQPIIAQAKTFNNSVGTVNSGFKITAPTPGANIPSDQPAIKGTGAPGKEVILTISTLTKPIINQLVINQNGLWSWTPPVLSPGKHILTATSFTSQNDPVASSVTFTVLKSGTQVLGDATPSASLTPSPSTSPKLSPTPTPKPSVLLTPTPTATSTPVSGTTEPTILLIALGIGIMLVGTLGFAKKFS